MYDIKKINDSYRNPILFKKLNIIEKILFYEMYVSEKILITNNLHYDFEKTLEEIRFLNLNLFDHMVDHLKFYEELYVDIHEVISNKKFKTNFDIKMDYLNIICYFTLIIKSLRYVDNINLIDSHEKMLHRFVVYNSIGRLSQSLKLLNCGNNVLENCFKIIIILSNNNFVKTKKITLKKKNKIKTDFYLKLNIIDENIYLNRINLIFSYEEFKKFDNYYISNSYLTLHKYIKKSYRQITVNNVDRNALDKLNKRKIKLNYDHWISIKKHIIDGYNKIFDISLKINDDVVKISCLIDEMYLQKSILIEENYRELKIKEYEKIIQKLYYLLIFEYAEKIISNKWIYFSYWYDFRGRIYSISNFDPLYLKSMRPFFKIEYDEINLKSSLYYKKIVEMGIKLPFKVYKEENYYYLIIFFMEIGKIFKMNRDSLENLVNKGINFYNNPYYLEKIEDFSYYLNIKDGIDHFLKYGEIINITILRDATASNLQHWGVLLQPKNNVVYDYLNLNSDIWYDSYEIIIELFVVQYGYKEYIDDILIKKIMNRKNLKKIIMTINYNAGYKICENYLIEKISKKFYDNNKNIIDKFLSDFYKFIEKELFEQLFIKNKDIWIKENKDNIFVGNDKLNLNYLKKKENKKIIKINNQRWIFVNYELYDEIDVEKTERAFSANIIQAHDADFARYVILHVICFIIHDCFGVSIFNLHLLMDYANKYFNIKMNNDRYSIFILV